MQTKISVGKEDSGKSIQLGVGDLLEVGLPETDPRAAWHVEVDADVLAPVSSPTNTQAVWVLDEVEQMHIRTFRAARVGRAVLKMLYARMEGGAAVDAFTLEAVIGNPPKTKPIRQQMPASQLLVMFFQAFLIAAAGAYLSFRLSALVATLIDGRRPQVDTADLLLGLLGTVAMGTVAGYALVRIVAYFASRVR
ncbi:MAG: hypothetical protein JSV65_07760 [Armatimonadota bacterium]|nr:MAG: hypothetical protein JSV65_07760 [Armatimonadota bacterium]